MIHIGTSSAEGSHSGLVRPPAKRVGGVELPRGFESRTLRHFLSLGDSFIGYQMLRTVITSSPMTWQSRSERRTGWF